MGNGTIDINGGTLQINDDMVIAYHGHSAGAIYLRGGLIDIKSQLILGGGATGPGTGLIDISGGTLIIEGDVDLIELSKLMQFWLTDEPSVDIVPDGIINFLDFTIVAENWTGGPN